MSRQFKKQPKIAITLLLLLAFTATVVGCRGEAVSQPETAKGSGGRAAELEEMREQIARRNTEISGSQRVSSTVGEAGQKVTVLWGKQDGAPPPNAVVFLHGWSPLLGVPEVYGAWIKHLIDEGEAVIFPSYIGLNPDPETVAEFVFKAVRIGLREFPVRPQSVAVIGYTTGGALAFDYAAGAARAGLPAASEIFAIYPARNPGGKPIPAIDPSAIEPDTQIRVLAGEGNPVVGGEEQARRLLQTVKKVPHSNKRYLSLDPLAVPWRADSHARQGIWRPLDELIAGSRQ